MEPVLAALAASARAVLRHGRTMGKRLPELVRGTTLEDLKSVKRRAEQGLDILTGDNKSESSGASGASARPCVISQYAFGHTDAEAIVRWRGRRLLLSLSDAMAEGFSYTSEYIASRRWPWAVVAVLFVAGGCVLVWHFRRPAQGAAAADQPRRSRPIVVTQRLPLRAEPNPESQYGFDFSVDSDSIPLFARGLPRPVTFVGALPDAAASTTASEGLAADLLEDFNCYPVLLEPNIQARSYGFCYHYLRPMFIPSYGDPRFDGVLYRGYVSVNMQYADRLLELLDPDEDVVLVHGYQLLAVPQLVRRRSPRAHVDFILFHSAFPTWDWEP